MLVVIYVTINCTDINFSNILLDKKLYENISVYGITYRTSTGPKTLRIRFDKIDGFIIIIDGKIKHLSLFDYGLFNNICDKVKYLMTKKSGITNSIYQNFGKIKIDSYNTLIKKILTFHKVIILIKLLIRIKINTTIIYF